MKPPVVGPTGRPQTSPSRRLSKAGAAGRFADHLDALPASQAAESAPQSAEVFSVGALVALQALAGDGRRRQARRHGETVLDSLDQLRTDLLLGRISGERLTHLVRLLRERDGPSGDAALDQTIDAIELRAEVELAKLSHHR